MLRSKLKKKEVKCIYICIYFIFTYKYKGHRFALYMCVCAPYCLSRAQHNLRMESVPRGVAKPSIWQRCKYIHFPQNDMSCVNSEMPHPKIIHCEKHKPLSAPPPLPLPSQIVYKLYLPANKLT